MTRGYYKTYLQSHLSQTCTDCEDLAPSSCEDKLHWKGLICEKYHTARLQCIRFSPVNTITLDECLHKKQITVLQ